MKHNNRLILAKIQPTPLVDPVPVAGTNSVLVRDIRWTEIEITEDQRQLVRGYFGGYEDVAAASYGTLEIDVELQGSSVLGTPPAYGPLLRMAGLGETIVAATSVAYKPITINEEAGAFYYFMDGNLYKHLDCKGSGTCQFNELKLPFVTLKYTGLRVAAGSAAVPAPVFTAFKKPLPVNKANTPTCTLHGQAVVMSQFSLDMGQEVTYINRPGREAVDFTGRNTSGQLVIEEPLISVVDFYDKAATSSVGAFAITHGTVPGLRVKVTSANVQVKKPTPSMQNNVAMLSIPLKFIPTDAGNDEFTILFD